MRFQGDIMRAASVLLALSIIGSLIFFLGCDLPTPTPPKPSVIQFKAPAFNDDQDILAYSLAQASTVSPSPSPAPDSDKPKVGDVCPVCNGRGKSGDGIQPCAPCSGDGRVDEHDPIMHSSLPQEEEEDTKVEEDSIKIVEGADAPALEAPDISVEVDGVEYLPKKDFEAWQTGDFSEKTSSITKSIQDRASELEAKVNEEIGKLGGRINELAATMQSVQDALKSLDQKVQSISTPYTPPASKPEVPTSSSQGVDSSKKVEYDYCIQYEGTTWTWDGVSAFKSALPNDSRQINFPNLSNIEEKKEVQVCVDTPQGRICTVVPVERVPKSQAVQGGPSVDQMLPPAALKQLPSKSQALSNAAKKQVLDSNRLVPQSTDWQKIPSHGPTNDPVLIKQRVPVPPLPADQQPAPKSGVDSGLKMLSPKSNEILADYGCGDARWLKEAAIKYGVEKAIGIEIDPAVAELARRHVEVAGLSDRIEIITGDAVTTNVKADIGVVYQFPDLLEKLKPQLMKLKRFVSYAHPMPGAVPGFSVRRNGDIYLYTKLTPVAIKQPTSPVQQQVIYPSMSYYQDYQPMAVYRGRTYSRPMCNSPGCSMCNSIRRQLWR